QSSELRWRVRRPRRLLSVARCERRRPARLYDPDGRARRKCEPQSLQGVRRGEPAGRLEPVARLYARAGRACALDRAAAAHVHEIAIKPESRDGNKRKQVARLSPRPAKPWPLRCYNTNARISGAAGVARVEQ